MALTIEGDGVSLASSNGTGTFGPFKLMGGYYSLDTGTGTGTANLQKINADGVVINPTASAQAANAHAVLQLPPGLYQLVIATSGIDVGVTKIKGGI